MSLNLLLVTFSLRDPNKDYSNFFVVIRGNALNWAHYIEQTVVLTTYNDADNFAKMLLPYINATDSLLVCTLDPERCQGWLPKEAWEWFTQIARDRTPSPHFLPPVR